MPPVVRVWTGYGSPEGVDRYCREHFPEAVLPHLRAVDGFLSAQVLTRALEDETQVVVATTWTSVTAIKAFAGEDYAVAVVEPAVRDLLIRFDERVSHFTLALQTSSSGDLNTASSVPPCG
jgi:Antibiotic biosynthesis monooxygenase